MPPLPVIHSSTLIKALQKAGFQVTRQRGSHVRLCHPDGRIVTVPVHAGQDVGRGLLRKILRDAELSVEELLRLL
ncbi:MAG TPA: type II toxin-antitoxin system HicA family toxin [Anaerolineae bacterium]|nr:type II toxin-antitoxin system HicA family toxin [Anaerolineae bacterium]HQI83891.1 type II toxin-antitoxin system HicA family toxin [Anaerolineae bacterium]